MKNKEWLKEQLSYLQDGVGESFNDYSRGLNAAYNTIGLLINELEEPEQEKVVVPRFVADWIEEERNSNASYVGIRLRFHAFELPEKINNYMNENYETFTRAWFDGYSVEKFRCVLKIGKMYFVSGGVNHGQEFNIKLTDNKESAHVFESEQEAKDLQSDTGGKLEEITK